MTDSTVQNHRNHPKPPPSPFREDILEGQSILVTGGGSDLGKGVARHFAQHGATVHIWGRRENVLQETAEEISQGARGTVHYQAVDVRDSEAVGAAVGDIWERYGPLTGAMNNAAGNFIAQTKDLSPRGFQAITDTVMKGSYNVTHAVGRRWIEQGLTGNILSTLVSWVYTGSPFVVPSAMAKSAVNAMTMSLAVEWAKYGIRLNAIAPGPIPTEFTSVVLSSNKDGQGAMTDIDAVPAGRPGTVEEMGNLAIFLISGACDYITGQTITMDGGQMLAGPSTFSALAGLDDSDWAEIAEKGKRAAAESKKHRNV
ncbi:SDR family oxidoreductase [Curtobacterium sp. S6]|uniref:SDR family oxidoreductase n=1 Tax=Curtobacterium sp. S6 TaxID=1479623 RepID=UPI00068D18CA|nr:SDR family oxidoreductase [Curtobacterium sp. S6]